MDVWDAVKWRSEKSGMVMIGEIAEWVDLPPFCVV